jgi:hypothetical protein
MVEGCWQPCGSGVAGPAVGPEPATMRIAIPMAAITVSGRALVDIIDMAVRTGHTGVSSGQFERGQVMVKAGWQPCRGGVATAAVCSKPPTVRVTILMAAITVCGCAFVDIIDMTVRTSHTGVLSGQFEGGQAMVKAGWQPCSGGVA